MTEGSPAYDSGQSMSPRNGAGTAGGTPSASAYPTLAAVYPEMGAGGYSSVDGTVEFYGRINALLLPTMRVLDFGAGRGREVIEEYVAYRRGLRVLRGKVAMVLGADIDPSITMNPSLDSAVIVEESRGLPLASESIDLIVCDYTFEHLSDPGLVTAELDRVLKPGGWLCARTPNRWGYIAIGARLVPNYLHVAALRRLQPHRKSQDVFPTRYALNTRKSLTRYFSSARYADYSYFYNCEPVYFGKSVVATRIARRVLGIMPDSTAALLMVFKQKVSQR